MNKKVKIWMILFVFISRMSVLFFYGFGIYFFIIMDGVSRRFD